jgi:hypothetical protein
MVHATERKLRRKEKVVPQPLPSTKFPKTQLAFCLLGVSIRRAMHMAIDAKTFIGANQRSIWWSVLVGKEQMAPRIRRMAIDARAVCAAVLLGSQQLIEAEFNVYIR